MLKAWLCLIWLLAAKMCMVVFKFVVGIHDEGIVVFTLVVGLHVEYMVVFN